MKIVAVEPIGITKAKYEELKSMFLLHGADFDLFEDRNENPEVLIERMRDADAVIISNIPLSKDVLKHCVKLKMLSVAFTGLDHIDLEYCKNNNIVVRNAAGYATIAVAELALGLMLDLYRHITWLDADTRQLQTRKAFLGRQLNGKTVGIVGTGAIGVELARILLAMGCHVIAWNRSRHEAVEKMGISYVSLEELMQKSDIVSLHVPLTTETKCLISKEMLALCKPTAILINTARGNVVDIDAVAECLRNRTIAGAAFDVFEKEPPLSENHPLLNTPNCIVVPHIGYATREAFDIRIDICIESLLRESVLFK